MTRGTYIAVAFIVVAGLMFLAGAIGTRIRERRDRVELIREAQSIAWSMGYVTGLTKAGVAYRSRIVRNQKAGVR